MIELVRIPTKNVNDAWGMVLQNIADALARSNGYARAEHIKKWILEDKMQLWILWDSQDKKYYGVVVTEILEGSPLMFVSKNDVIVELQKKKIVNTTQFANLVSGLVKKGSKTLYLAIYNSSNQRSYITVKLK